MSEKYCQYCGNRLKGKDIMELIIDAKHSFAINNIVEPKRILLGENQMWSLKWSLKKHCIENGIPVSDGCKQIIGLEILQIKNKKNMLEVIV